MDWQKENAQGALNSDSYWYACTTSTVSSMPSVTAASDVV
jgi:hypothetical protein